MAYDDTRQTSPFEQIASLVSQIDTARQERMKRDQELEKNRIEQYKAYRSANYSPREAAQKTESLYGKSGGLLSRLFGEDVKKISLPQNIDQQEELAREELKAKLLKAKRDQEEKQIFFSDPNEGRVFSYDQTGNRKYVQSVPPGSIIRTLGRSANSANLSNAQLVEVYKSDKASSDARKQAGAILEKRLKDQMKSLGVEIPKETNLLEQFAGFISHFGQKNTQTQGSPLNLETQQIGDPTSQAVQYLKSKGQPVTQANVDYVIQQLRKQNGGQ